MLEVEEEAKAVEGGGRRAPGQFLCLRLSQFLAVPKWEETSLRSRAAPRSRRQGRTGRAGAWGRGTATPVRARVRELVPLPLETLKYPSGQGCWSRYQSLWRDAGAGTSLIRDVEGDVAPERRFGLWQCSGVGGVMEQVPEQDTGAGSLLAGDDGASCSLGVLGTCGV